MSAKKENDLFEDLFPEMAEELDAFFRKLESLCEEYHIKDRAEPIYQLLGDDVMDLTDYTKHYEDVISMCKALLALKKEVSFFSMTIGSRKFEFNTSGLVPGLPGIVPKTIEIAIERALIKECSETYEYGTKDEMLFRIYEAHCEIIWQDGEGKERFKGELTDYEIRYIKRTYEECLEYEKKAEGNKKSAGYNTKRVKLGLIARKIMESLPNDMDNKEKRKFIADFLVMSGALTSRNIIWIEDRDQFVKDLLKAVNHL
jgi:hypothetical protein